MLKRLFNYQLALLGLFIFCLSGVNAYAQDYKVVRAVMDVHSDISDGSNSLEEIAGLAREKGLAVVIFGDCALRKWEYGLRPFRNLIKKTYQENSVLRLGIKRYLKELTGLKKKFPDLTLIPGVETSPYFYWEGSPFSKRRDFFLIDYYKQFLVIGLKPKDYQNLPIVGNRQFSHFSKESIFSLWPILLIIFGLKAINKKAIGISLLLLGGIFLLNNLPFPVSRFNVYQSNLGVKPYQDLIDYVNKKGGLIFWAHPEMLTKKVYYGVELYTASHTEDLFLTQDYTGFGINDMLKMSEPGSGWDKILLEHIGGKRKKPAWAIAALHYTKPPAGIDRAETLFLVRAAGEKDILEALREGRMYVRFNLGGEPAVLTEFKAERAGQGSIQITIKGYQVSSSEPLKIELIRNGQIFKAFEEARSDWMITVEDNLAAPETKVYYRLKIKSPSSIILSNPVFVGVKN